MLSPSAYGECDLKMAADVFCQGLDLILDTRNILDSCSLLALPEWQFIF